MFFTWCWTPVTPGGFVLNFLHPSVCLLSQAMCFRNSALWKLLSTQVRPQPQSWKSFPPGNLCHSAKWLIVGITVRALSWAKASVACTHTSRCGRKKYQLNSYYSDRQGFNNKVTSSILHCSSLKCTLLAKLFKYLNKLWAPVVFESF